MIEGELRCVQDWPNSGGTARCWAPWPAAGPLPPARMRRATDSSSSDVFTAQPSPKPLGRFSPRNECISLPGAKSFFLDFERAVQKRDADALLNLTDPKVKLDFGGNGGISGFRERLADKQGQLWDALDTLTHPWLRARPERRHGDAMVRRSADGRHRHQQGDDRDRGGCPPAAGTQRLGPQACERELGRGDAGGWIQSGRRISQGHDRIGQDGLYEAAKLRSPLDYRLRIARFGDNWRIVSFVKGD